MCGRGGGGGGRVNDEIKTGLFFIEIKRLTLSHFFLFCLRFMFLFSFCGFLFVCFWGRGDFFCNLMLHKLI